MQYRRLGLPVSVIAAVVAAFGASPVSASTIPVIDDSQMQALTASFGGATPTSTTRTVQHWFGQTLDPHNGVTYGYNMVGTDPSSNSSPAIQADITPVNVNLDGMTFSGSGVLAATLASPQFANNDYGSTVYATVPGCRLSTCMPKTSLTRGGDGVTPMALSQGDAGNLLQLEDATMRAQFNRTGASNYHLVLNPNVLPAVTIDVPSSQGVLLQSGRGVIFADINITWWAAKIQNLNTSADPTHLPIWLTNNVLLHVGPNPFNCCVIGFHGASEVNGRGAGSTKGNGNQVIQTYAWASWVQPGLYSRPNGGTDWALQDIHAVSHEVAEWADDPFTNNTVEPWLTPTAPQYGCTRLLETGDPVVAIGFAMGTNSFQQGPNPNGTQSADGFYHPEDEAYLSWFMRTAPNNVAEPTQSPSTNIGRYTLMGDLNPFDGFRQPATGC